MRNEHDKDHVLFPRKVGGRYAALHRRWPGVWLAHSGDLVTWPEEAMACVYGLRSGNGWDSHTVGNGGVPIETEHGWLAFNHGVDGPWGEGATYRLGLVLLDLDGPVRLVNRPKDPILWPEELWELRGDVPRVVFSCANPVVDGTAYVYYGGGDHVVGLATCALDELVEYALRG